MAQKKAFLLRLDPKVYAALRKWAADELRSMNGQIEFLLRRALIEAGRLERADQAEDQSEDPEAG
ncbi:MULTISPECIES: DNA-binding protein [Limnochorda]|uniref:DNA-binding protein n=1 Tax=Limnochorda TaxID=1676651 RepID=UPI0018048F5C|nr:DNA-binding protein [Limnochorda pilosa]MBO2486434.1 hypothetical protein [Bacillota bacterium]MBO2520013.1 hypothetical protein [Bacillota bacterium]NMA71278.1 hypothetical protein [Bacillota bacterium]